MGWPLTWLSILATVCARFNFAVHAYCQMTNHYHIVLETVDGDLAKGLRQLNGTYSQWFNRQICSGSGPKSARGQVRRCANFELCWAYDVAGFRFSVLGSWGASSLASLRQRHDGVYRSEKIGSPFNGAPVGTALVLPSSSRKLARLCHVRSPTPRAARLV